MIWKSKKPAWILPNDPLKIGDIYWKPFFCFRPRWVEGYTIWWEWVLRRQKQDYGEPVVYNTFKLTEAQCIRLGVKW